jgi:hypothetical protein
VMWCDVMLCYSVYVYVTPCMCNVRNRDRKRMNLLAS